jgi:hypothetical protein
MLDSLGGCLYCCVLVCYVTREGRKFIGATAGCVFGSRPSFFNFRELLYGKEEVLCGVEWGESGRL